MTSYQKLKVQYKELNSQLNELVLHPDSELSEKIKFRIKWLNEKEQLLLYGSPRRNDYTVNTIVSLDQIKDK